MRNIVGSKKTHNSESISQSKGKHEWNRKNNMMMIIRTKAFHKELIECVDEHNKIQKYILCRLAKMRFAKTHGFKRDKANTERSKTEFSKAEN